MIFVSLRAGLTGGSVDVDGAKNVTYSTFLPFYPSVYKIKNKFIRQNALTVAAVSAKAILDGAKNVAYLAVMVQKM